VAGVFMGWTDRLEFELAPGDSRVATFLPYRLRSILVETLGPPPDAARPGPELIEVTLKKTGDGPFEVHVLELDVEGPGGRKLAALRRLIEVSGGRAGIVIPFAQSDPKGLWTVRLREAATGLAAVRRFVRTGG
jgi:hypothetical protein